MTTDLILGTAGHIDHGKTTLIKALTGVDADRLPEEKRRGITIELGFAELTIGPYCLGIVDVPGHERFVRTMLAGATGMDIAMLIVAADESVKQQTREHLEILRLLDLPAGVIVLTKCDMADPEWIELVTEEIRELVQDSFLADAPIVQTSATTGQGIEELRDMLQQAAAKAAERATARQQAPFRMAIDRTFTVPGHGTVVTGSVSSGKAEVGQRVMIEPGSTEVRIRQIHNHERPSEEIHRGQRAAINLGGIHHEQISRGQELCSEGHLQPSRLLTVQIDLLAGAPWPLKNRARIRVHLGTAELLATVILLDVDRLEPGGQALAQFFLPEPAVATWNQPLVLRSESPVTTIGGGRVLDPNAIKLRKPGEATLSKIRELTSKDPLIRAAATLYLLGLRPWVAEDLIRRAGVSQPVETCQQLLEDGTLCEIAISPTRKIRIHAQVLEELADRIAKVLKQLHQANPLRSAIQRAQVVSQFDYLEDTAVLDYTIAQMHEAGTLRNTTRGLTLKGEGPKLSANERKLLARLVETYLEAGLEVPSVKESAKQAGPKAEVVPQLLRLAAADGDLVEISAELFLHTQTEELVRQLLTNAMENGTGLTISEIREVLGTTRKYAVPLCEYYDRTGFTTRQGDVRVLCQLPTSEQQTS